MGRKVTRCLNILIDFANLFKAFIGVNYLSIAFAISQSGIALGIIGLLLISVATVHGCHLLIKCKRVVIQNILKDNLPSRNQQTDDEAQTARVLSNEIEKRLSYGDIAFMTLGKFGTILVNFSLVVTQFGFCVNYFIFLGNSFEKMFPYYLPYISLIETNSSHSAPPIDVVAHGNHEDSGGNVQAYPNSSTAANILPFSLMSNSPGYNVLVALPLPLFILFGYLRSVRHMGPVSVIANLSVFIGYIAMLAYLLKDFSVSDSVVWFRFSTLPIFFGQVTGSYEGIGTIVPIESSMDDNHHLFAFLLHLVIVVFTCVLGSMGFIGYLRLGTSTAQVIIWNLEPGSILQLLVSLVVCLSVVFTFPLQCFPVIEIFEELIFAEGRCCGPPLPEVGVNQEEESHIETRVVYSDSFQDDSELQHLLQDPQVAQILKQLPVATVIPQSVPTWRRNILRTLIVVTQLGVAYALKDEFAYFSALIGAIGSTLIAYIIPALLHLKLKWQEVGILVVIKDVLLILFGIVGGISGIYASVLSIIQNFE